MTTFLNSTFTVGADVTLQGHAAETGGVWQKHPSYTATASINAANGWVLGDSTGTAIYYNDLTPPTADYEAEVVIQRTSTGTAASNGGIVLRCSPTANTFYHIFYADTSSQVEVHRMSAGTTAMIGTPSPQTFPINTDATLRARVVGGVITVWWNGVQVIEVTDGTPLTGGHIGIRMRNATRIKSVTANNDFVGTVTPPPPPPPPASATKVSDDFNDVTVDTALAGRVAPTGGTWTRHPSFTGTATVTGANQRVKGDSASSTAIYYNNVTMGTADYDVHATVLRTSTAGGDSNVGLIARCDATAQTFYHAFYADTSNGVELWKTVANVTTQLGVTVAADFPVNTNATMRLRVKGSTLTVWWNDVELISTSDTEITAAGYPGLRARSAGRVDNFVATTDQTFTGTTGGGGGGGGGGGTPPANDPTFIPTAAPTGMTAAATAIVNAYVAAGASLSTGQQHAILRFVRRLSTKGLWTKLTAIYVPAFEQVGANINWKSPGTYNATVVGSPTWTAGLGYSSSSTSNFLDTGIPLSAINSASVHMSLFAANAASNGSNGADMGAYDTAGSTSLILTATSSAGTQRDSAFTNAQVDVGTSTMWDANRWHCVSRVSGATSSYMDGILRGSRTETAVASTSATTITILKGNGGAARSTRTISAATIGTGLVAQEAQDLYGAIDTLVVGARYGNPNFIDARTSGTETLAFDAVIYGTTSQGVVAAYELARQGFKVALVGGWRDHPGNLGGMSAGGLGNVDFENLAGLGGLPRAIISWINTDVYARTDNQTRFEPRIFHAAMRRMMDPKRTTGRIRGYNVPIYHSTGVVSGVKSGAKLTSITTRDGRTFTADWFMDCTYEGDLLPVAGIPYTAGREAAGSGAEAANGYRGTDTAWKGDNHQYLIAVSPFVVASDPSSGRLPGIVEPPSVVVGTADDRIQAYNFRLTWTDILRRRVPFTEYPTNFDPAYWEPLIRTIEGTTDTNFGAAAALLIGTTGTTGVYDINARGGKSTDFWGGSQMYLEAGLGVPSAATYTERERVWKLHEQHIRHLLHVLCFYSSPRIRAGLRNGVLAYGWDSAHHTDPHPNDVMHFPTQLYVRELRRMIGMAIWDGNDITASDSTMPRSRRIVSVASYALDSHHNRQLAVQIGGVWRAWNEGGFENLANGGTDDMSPLPMEIFLPREVNCTNMAVPFACSSTHVGFGSIRMEFTSMQAAQSMAVAMRIAQDSGLTALQRVPYSVLHSRLASTGDPTAPVLLQADSSLGVPQESGSGVPIAPSNLAVTSFSDTTVSLSWVDNSTNEDAFELSRATNSGFTTGVVTLTLSANDIAETFTGLTNNTTYYFRVRARNSDGTSAWSNVVTQITGASGSVSTAPVAPSGLTANATGSTTATVSWTDNSTNETAFILERSTSSAFSSVVSTTLGANTTSAAVTGLSAGTTYYWRVAARNSSGDSAWSATGSTTTSSGTVTLDAPPNLAAAAVSTTSINVTWGDVSNETGYEFQSSTSASFTGASTTSLAANTTSRSLTSLSADTTYYIRVRAMYAGGPSAWSTTSATTQTAVVVPPPPPTPTPAPATQTIFIEPPVIVVPEPIREISASSATSGFPSRNLLRLANISQWRSAGGTQTITIRLSPGRPIDMVALLLTNATSSTTIRAMGASTESGLSSPAYTSSTITFWASTHPQSGERGYHSYLRFNSPQTYEWWRIEVAGAPNPFIATHLVCGLRRKATRNINRGASEEPVDLGSIEFTPDGAANTRDGVILRRAELELVWLNESEYETMFRPLWWRVGTTKPCLVIPNSYGSPFLHDRILYGHFERMRGAHETGKFFGQSCTFLSVI